MRAILSCLSFLFLLNTVYAVPFGEGTVQYGTAKLPDKPTVYSTRYYPATNTALAIQEAIDAANTAGGGTVELAAMTYQIDSPILLKSKVRILGAGMGQTIITRSLNFPTNISSYLVGATDASLTDSELRSLTIDGGYTRQELADGPSVLCGIRLESCAGYYNERIRIIYTEVKGCTVGIQMSGVTHITIQSCDVHDNGGTYLHHNIYFRRTGQALFYKNHIYNSIGGSGLKLAGGTTTVSNESRYFTIRDNDIYDNERINLNIQGCHHLLIEGNVLENQLAISPGYLAGLYLVEYGGYQCRYTDIINNAVIDNAQNGMYVKGCDTFSIKGNACLDNGATDYNILNCSNYSCDYNSNY